jgi:hypothetical protein
VQNFPSLVPRATAHQSLYGEGLNAQLRILNIQAYERRAPRNPVRLLWLLLRRDLAPSQGLSFSTLPRNTCENWAVCSVQCPLERLS